MTPKNKILFLQLPRLDIGPQKEQENIPLAGIYLWHAWQRRFPARGWRARFLDPREEQSDDAGLLGLIRDWRPDYVCATLYLWNIERTLHLLKAVKKKLPACRMILGGPETARSHPFLFRSRVADAVVTGEGEAVFPLVLQAWQEGRLPDFLSVAFKTSRGYQWGRRPVPILSLSESLPPASYPRLQPDANGMAYLESVRGCPLQCTYCRYSQMRRELTYLRVSDVTRRVRVFMRRGASQIRFVDPTFNAHPEFLAILKNLKKLNARQRVRFFAELRADTLKPEEISLLAEAGFQEVEIGVQSRDPEILRRLQRPTRFPKLESNLRLLGRAGIRVTVDLMYGLPGQTRKEVLESIAWAGRFKRADVQCLQTLLLPGTVLAAERKALGLRAEPRPPYGVCRTPDFSEDDFRETEEFLNRKWAADGMTARFVGRYLPDLFRERVIVPLEGTIAAGRLPGRDNRRALIFRGANLYAFRKAIGKVIRQAIRREPHVLWQFVLQPEEEVPLNLLADMAAEIRRHAKQWIDRFASAAGWDRLASRRIFILLKKERSYSAAWTRAATRFLEDAFF